MSTQPPDAKVRPSAVWYVVPIGLWLVSLGLFIAVVISFADFINAGVERVQNNSQVTVPEDGLTVYSTSFLATGDCTLTSPDEPAIALDSFDSEFSFGAAGAKYYALASTPEGMEPGSYRLNCAAVGGTGLGVGQRLDVGAVVIRGIWGFLVPLVLGFIGLVVLIVLLVKRHNSKSRLRAQQRASAAGYGGGWGSQSPPSSGPGSPNDPHRPGSP